MKLSTELRNLPIVSIAEGEEVGVVKDFIIDPVEKAIVAIVVEDVQWFEGAKVVAFSLIHSIGNFAITIENSSSVVSLTTMPELTGLIRKNVSIIGSKVITRGGRLVGFIKEYSVNANSGNIVGLELTSESELMSPDKTIIPASAIVTIGRDVIIVEEDIESTLCATHEEIEESTKDIRYIPSAVPKFDKKTKTTIFEEKTLPVDEDEELPPIEDITGILDEEEPTTKTSVIDEPIPDIGPDLTIPTDPFAAEVEDIPSGSKEEPSSKASLSDIFEERQRKYMLGKKVSRDIETEDGTAIVKQGGIITEDIINKAKQAGKFLELSMNIEIED